MKQIISIALASLLVFIVTVALVYALIKLYDCHNKGGVYFQFSCIDVKKLR